MDNTKIIDFDQLQLKFVKGVWQTTTSFNYDDNFEKLQNFAIEMYCMRDDLLDIYNRASQLDQAIKFNNKTITPDIVVRDNRNVIERILEFKCSFFNFNAAFREETRKSLIQSGNYPEFTELIFLTLNNNFSTLIKNRELREIYLIMLRDIENYRAKFKNKVSMFNIKKDKDITPTTDQILENHPYVLSQTLDDSNLSDYLSLDEINEGILKNFKRMEEFANYNFLSTDEMVNYIPSEYQENISIESPWDYKYNKNKFKNLYGQKCNYLYQIIPNGLIQNCDLKEWYDNSIEFKNVLIEEIRWAVKINNSCGIELKQIKDVINIKAYYKTEASSEDVSNMANKLNCNQNDIILKLDGIIYNILEKIKDKTKFPMKLSKHGNVVISDKFKEIRLNLNNFRKIKTAEDKLNESEIAALEFNDWFKINENIDLSKLFKRNVKNLESLNVKQYLNAYLPNKTVNELSNKLISDGVKNIKDIFETPEFSSIYSYIQFYRAIIAAVPRLETKGSMMNEGVLTKHPDGYYIYITPSPNEITTGIIVLLGKISDYPPDWVIPIEFHNNFFISKPFRVNLKIALSADALLGSYMGTTLLLKSLNIEIKNNLLWNSIWWSFTRQMTLVMDYIYLYYNNIYNVGNFGKYELAKKFNDLNYRDVRTTAIMFRLKNNFNLFYEQFNQTKHIEPFLDCIDPIFGFKHTGWQSFLTISYLKQIIPKDDGYDAGKLLGGFYRDDLEYKKWYDESYFNKNKSFNIYKKMEIDDFFNKILNESNTEWTNLSVHPDSVLRYHELVIEKAKSINKYINPRQTWEIPAMMTGVSSKCNIPEEQSKLYKISEKDELQNIEKKSI